MLRPTLSICIPTYNRASFLRARLAELETLLTEVLCDRIEVLVSNNGSPDSTDKVVKEFQGRFRNFRYLNNPQNYGADYNFIQCMTEASGDYIWIFGDDDYFLPHSIIEALRYIDSGRYSLIIGNQQIGESYTSRDTLGDRMFHIDSDVEGGLLSLCQRFGYLTLLGFVSSLIFKKPMLSAASWCRHQGYESALVHSTVVFESLSKANTLVTAQPLLRVEPPIEHQTREHQSTQDPRVNFRMWTLNLICFMSDMKRRGIIDERPDSQFFLVPHCRAPLVDHVIGSFRTTIAEHREIAQKDWNKIEDFLVDLGDIARLDKLKLLRQCHDQVLGPLISLHSNHEVRDRIICELEQLI